MIQTDSGWFTFTFVLMPPGKSRKRERERKRVPGLDNEKRARVVLTTQTLVCMHCSSWRGWMTPFLVGFWVSEPQKASLTGDVAGGSQVGTFLSTLSPICWLTSLAWSSRPLCNCSTFPWILLRLWRQRQRELTRASVCPCGLQPILVLP